MSDEFTTKAINIVLTVENTLNTFCIGNPPTATVRMSDTT
jgi:hypothetical protein